MSFLGLCDGDPIVNALRDVFGANIVRVPEERIKPLRVVASSDDKSSFRGELTPLLKGNVALNIPVTTSQMADISGKRSRKVNIDLGLEILDGFLKGFGITSAEIGIKFQGASEVSFSFKNVVRNYIDIGLLGKALAGQKVEKENPAARIFFDDTDYSFLVIDSVITSSDFLISVDKSSDSGFKLDIPTIQNIVNKANVGVQVTTTNDYDIVFKGPEHLTFAFSCVKLYLDADGTIMSMPPAYDVPALKIFLAKKETHVIEYSPDRVLLNAKPALLSWDKLG